MLTARLHLVIAQLISHTQMAFIRGCSIQDGLIVASKVLDAMKWHRQGRILKLEFEKAYDRVDWSFLSFMMCRMGFDARWVQWINGCAPIAPTSMLVSGSPGPSFNKEHGLK